MAILFLFFQYRFSQSTPNLNNHDHNDHTNNRDHYHKHNHNPQSLYFQPSNHDVHQQYYYTTLDIRSRNRLNHLFDEPNRLQYKHDRKEKKIHNIRKSSASLIQLIRHTSDQLRQEMANLENFSNNNIDNNEIEVGEFLHHVHQRKHSDLHHYYGDKSRIQSSSLIYEPELMILGDGDGVAKKNLMKKPEIFLNNNNNEDDDNLIRQLRIIRNKVNDRLNKMSVVIEQQKITQI